ncbi:MAG: hypothetical protein ACJAYU_003953 [Bradymonadia bacterium]|jgi:uncharacterized protein (TIGR00255 family)
MTGFGEAATDSETGEVRVSMRSVNLKQLDVRVALPTELGAFEQKVAAEVKSRLLRGRVDVRVSVVSRQTDADENWVAAARRLTAFAAEHGLAPVQISDVARAAQVGPASPVAVEVETLLSTIRSATDALVAFRVREGSSLQTFFLDHASRLEDLLQRIEETAQPEIQAHRDRLGERVSELLSPGTSVDETRLEQEIVIVAERADIAEEIQRATEHVRALRLVLNDEAVAAKGKRLDFLLQELIRETNTMASKSVSAKLTHLVVEAKSAIEQMREQAHNIE